MTPLAARLWHTLSGGERQRTHIARALTQEHAVLLLDGPTNHLNIRHQFALLALIRPLPVTEVMALHASTTPASTATACCCAAGAR